MIMDTSEAADALTYWSTQHCQSSRVIPRGGDQDYRYEIAEYIAALSPTPATVLEFGCGSARNLAILRGYLSNAELCGIDANPTTVAAAKHAYGDDIELHEGDQRLLDQFKDDAFDVVFTCSVLDHIPAPEWHAVYDELVRLARVAVVMLEPVWPGYGFPVTASAIGLTGSTRFVAPEYGKPQEPQHTQTSVEASMSDLDIEAPPFTYSHNYLGHDPLLRIVRRLPVSGLAQWADFGSLYFLLERRKDGVTQGSASSQSAQATTP